MAFTYAQLKTAIQDYTENTETSFVTNLPVFIRAAEDRIFKLVDLELFRKNATSALTQNDPYLSVPSDYLASFSLSITNGSNKVFLMQKDVNYLHEAHPNSSTTGTPRYYAFFDVENFLLAPTPNSGFTAELHYYYRPTSLTAGSDSGTTWLATNAPLAMLYGSLLEAYTFMKGEADVLQNYTIQFAESIGRLKNYGEALEDTDAYRTGLVRREKL